jgi:multiple sugar transport system substrate-binding protein
MKNRFGILLAAGALVASGALPAAAQDGDVTVSLARFFGDCDDATQGVTDVKQATSECEVIEILTNAFNAEDNGVTVEKIGAQNWGDYYTQLSTTFSAGDPPDVAVMHESRLPDFATRGLLTPIGDLIAEAGVDFSDYTEPAQNGATYDGQIFAVPFDIHASLWHMNVDLFAEAGLVDDAGMPIMPTSADELLAQCQQLQDATGKQYFGHDWFEFGVGARLFLGLVWQQGGELYDGTIATVDTPEGQEALRLLNELAANCSDPAQGYTDSQQGFLNGDIAVLHNGTWVVDQYNRDAGFDYLATNVPNLYGQPAAWGDEHLWTMPLQGDADPATTAASIEFLKYLYEHVGDWAIGTGHIAPRMSVIESEAYQQAPQRANYAETAETARLVPAVQGWAGAWDALAEELNATWVTGKDQAQALADAEARMNEELN